LELTGEFATDAAQRGELGCPTLETTALVGFLDVGGVALPWGACEQEAERQAGNTLAP